MDEKNCSTLASEATHVARSMASNLRVAEDEILDAISIAWEYDQGGRGNPVSIARYAVMRVRSARRFPGTSRSIDHPHRGQREGVGWDYGESDERSLWRIDDDPALIVAARVDFAAWRKTLSRRDRRALDLMVSGEKTRAIAARLRISPARVSQLRRELRDGYLEYAG